MTARGWLIALAVLLALSVATNLVAVGAGVALYRSGGLLRDAVQGVTQLPADVRRAFIRELAADRASLGAARQDLAAARQAMIDVLLDPAPDPDQLLETMILVRQRTARLQALVQQSLFRAATNDQAGEVQPSDPAESR